MTKVQRRGILERISRRRRHEEDCMEIRKIASHKKDYLPLLLLGDEQEDMIDRYLERGTLYALFIEDAARAICVVTDEGNGVLEIKNIAVAPAFQKKGLGRALIAYIENAYRQTHAVLQVGTGESPLTVPFYEKCGFRYSHRIPNFFTDHYDHPICEGGVLLRDMVYLQKPLAPR